MANLTMKTTFELTGVNKKDIKGEMVCSANQFEIISWEEF